MRFFRPVLAFLLVFMAFLADFAHPIAADAEQPVKVFVDTKQIQFEVQPLIVEGATLVQFRPLFEAMGMTVKWDNANRTVTGSKVDLTIALRIDDPKAMVNGKEVALSQPAKIVDGSTMVPLRFIGESTGAIVYWDQGAREVSVITDELLKAIGMTKEDMQKKLAAYDAKQQQQTPATNSSDPASNNPTPSPDPNAPTQQAPAQTQPTEKKPVDLAALSGMYYGFRDDYGGYECGGACYDIYTFLPEGRILVGLPPQGGPETIDCARDKCSKYTISDGKLNLDNGKSYKVGKTKDGYLQISDIVLFPVAPAPEGLKLQGTYKHISYYGLVGINAFSSSNTEYITFNKDGTFESTNITLAGLDLKVSTTDSSGSSSIIGTYQISDNTLILTYADGTVARSLFFDHYPGGKKSLESIQIADTNFYIPKDN